MAIVRSILSVPGHCLHAMNGARSRGADQIAWDLEDSVPTSRREEALINVLAVAKAGDAVRIYEGMDLSRLDSLAPGVSINVPKVTSRQDLANLRYLNRPLLAVIESPAAVRRVGDICEVADAVAFGRADFQASAGIANPDAALILHAMAEIAMTALAYGIPAYDSPCEILRSEREMRRETMRAIDYGFTGKICIHPTQIPICALFESTPDHRLSNLQGSGVRVIGGRAYAEPHYKLHTRNCS